MKKNLTFRQAKLNDIDTIINLIKDRINWMNEVDIEQWNKTDYLDVYPKSYFEEKINYFFVAECENKIVAAVALYTSDKRWKENSNSIFVHHLVSDINYKGAGKSLLQFSENYARENNFESIRLDSAVGNKKLEKFYTDLGYKPCGTCIDGSYHGILREKYL